MASIPLFGRCSTILDDVGRCVTIASPRAYRARPMVFDGYYRVVLNAIHSIVPMNAIDGAY